MPGIGKAKLHKLLYYVQGWHVTMTGEPLFSDDIEAWEKGPVVASLWRDEHHGIGSREPVALSGVGLATIELVLERYGSLSGAGLIDLTHAEPPWREAYEDPFVHTMSLSALREWFRQDGWYRSYLAEVERLKDHPSNDLTAALTAEDWQALVG
jgi:uncharacterized phage-associated protein